MYWQNVNITMETVEDLLKASRRLKISTLTGLCFQYMKNRLSAQTCIEIMEIAQRYENTETVALAKKYLVQNFRHVALTPSFCRLGKDDVVRCIVQSREESKVVWKALAAWLPSNAADSWRMEGENNGIFAEIAANYPQNQQSEFNNLILDLQDSLYVVLEQSGFLYLDSEDILLLLSWRDKDILQKSEKELEEFSLSFLKMRRLLFDGHWENAKLEAVLKWIGGNKARMRKVPDLFEAIDVTKLSSDFLLRLLRDEMTIQIFDILYSNKPEGHQEDSKLATVMKWAENKRGLKCSSTLCKEIHVESLSLVSMLEILRNENGEYTKEILCSFTSPLEDCAREEDLKMNILLKWIIANQSRRCEFPTLFGCIEVKDLSEKMLTDLLNKETDNVDESVFVFLSTFEPTRSSDDLKMEWILKWIVAGRDRLCVFPNLFKFIKVESLSEELLSHLLNNETGYVDEDVFALLSTLEPERSSDDLKMEWILKWILANRDRLCVFPNLFKCIKVESLSEEMLTHLLSVKSENVDENVFAYLPTSGHQSSSEDTKLSVILEWIKGDDDRKSQFPTLIKTVNAENLSYDYIMMDLHISGSLLYEFKEVSQTLLKMLWDQRTPRASANQLDVPNTVSEQKCVEYLYHRVPDPLPTQSEDSFVTASPEEIEAVTRRHDLRSLVGVIQQRTSEHAAQSGSSVSASTNAGGDNEPDRVVVLDPDPMQESDESSLSFRTAPVPSILSGSNDVDHDSAFWSPVSSNDS